MKVLKKISKYLLWFFIFMVVLLVGLYFFVQTETFSRWALEYTLGKMNKSWEDKDNRVNAESIHGNILKGLKLYNGSIVVKGDTLINFPSLEVNYDLWGLLKHRITVDLIDMDSPRIYLTSTKDKNGNLIWNYSNLFTPSEDTTGGPFDWDVTINNLKIEKGYFRIVGNRT